MRVLVIRHGETESNREKRIQGQTDTKLNARGEEQARDVAAIIRDVETLDAVFSSDLSRAFRTAEIIAGEDNEVTPVKGFRERYMGPIEGMLHSDAVIKRNEDGLKSLLEYGENGEELENRVGEAWEHVMKLSEKRGYQTVAVVSHGSALSHLFSYLLKQQPRIGFVNEEMRVRVLRQRPKLGNCSVTIIEDNKFVEYATQWTKSIVREDTLI